MLPVSCAIMLFGVIVMLLGVHIWRKRKISYISMHSDVREEDIKGFTRVVGWSTIGFGVSLFLLGLLTAYELTVIALAVFAACIILSLIIYFTAQAKYNSGADGTGHGGRVKKRNTVVRCAAICAVILLAFGGMAFLMYRSSLPPVFTVAGGELEISTDFGETISLSDIKTVELKSEIPKNMLKTNGLGLGSVLKGEFEADGSAMNVYVNTSDPPFIYIEATNGLTIISSQTKEKTQALYAKLKSEIK